MKLSERLAHAWNAFTNKETYNQYNMGPSYSTRPDRIRLTRGNERSIVTAVYNRIGLDCAAINIKHVYLDDRDRFIGEVDSGLNNCMSLEANIDQTGRAFFQDVVMSMLDDGVVAVMPVETKFNITKQITTDIISMRTAKIIEWYPKHVRLRAYDDVSGQFKDVIMPKTSVAIVENPLYAVMNEPNSTMQRLIRKLALLDVVDEQKGSNKLDMIIQLPYLVRTEAKRKQAEMRRNEIIEQLNSSTYGIAYTEGTERITQLNRSVDNQLFSEVERLTSMLYSQLGLTEEIMNGTADEKVMNNYYNRTIEPILSAIADEFKRKFLTKTARTRGQSIEFFRDPFKLVPTSEMADLADKFTRNEVLTSNEIRQIVGMKPSEDPMADELRNKNISMSPDQQHLDVNGNPIQDMPGEVPPEEQYPEEY